MPERDRTLMTNDTKAQTEDRGRALHLYACLLAALTCFLIFAGGAVTTKGAGLAVPDWPLSYGQIMPPMVGNIFYEHGHRMVATLVGMLTIGLAIWLQRKEDRIWLKRLGWAALAGVIAQGVLGGITVLFFLPTAISVSHAGVAELFFATTVAIALFTSRGWKQPAMFDEKPRALSLKTLTTLTALATYIQILFGALMRHTKAGLAIPDWPLSFGKIIPPFETSGVVFNFLHRSWALVVTVMVIWLLVRVLRDHSDRSHFRNPAILLTILVIAQITLGAYTIWTGKAFYPTTFHVAVGATTWATTVVLALRARRHLPVAQKAPAASLRVEGAPA